MTYLLLERDIMITFGNMIGIYIGIYRWYFCVYETEDKNLYKMNTSIKKKRVVQVK